MLKRLAIVLWWTGVIILAFRAWKWASSMEQAGDCSVAKITYGELQKQSDERIAKLKGKSSSELSDDELFDAIAKEPEMTAAKKRADDTCASAGDPTYIALLTLLCGAPFVVLAFILGGSFWRPPRLR